MHTWTSHLHPNTQGYAALPIYPDRSRDSMHLCRTVWCAELLKRSLVFKSAPTIAYHAHYIPNSFLHLRGNASLCIFGEDSSFMYSESLWWRWLPTISRRCRFLLNREHSQRYNSKYRNAFEYDWHLWQDYCGPWFFRDSDEEVYDVLRSSGSPRNSSFCTRHPILDRSGHWRFSASMTPCSDIKYLRMVSLFLSRLKLLSGSLGVITSF